MAIDDVRAFVVRSVDYGDTSKILTLFTSDRGIISVLAKGVKSPKSKKMNLCQVFTEANFELTKKNDFYFLKDGEIINSNSEILKDIKKIYFVQMIFDIIDKTIVNNEDNPDIFSLCHKTIEYISNTDNLVRLANMFLIKYISMIGFRPSLRLEDNSENTLYFSYELGGLTTERISDRNIKPIDRIEYAYLQQILFEIFENIGIIEGRLNESRIFTIIVEFLRYNTDILLPKSYENFTKLVGIK